MEFKELQEKNVNDLQKLLAQHREKLRDLNFKIANKELKNNQERKAIRKTIAHILTVLRNKRVGSQK